jgi:hypothetical protein
MEFTGLTFLYGSLLTGAFRLLIFNLFMQHIVKDLPNGYSHQ